MRNMQMQNTICLIRAQITVAYATSVAYTRSAAHTRCGGAHHTLDVALGATNDDAIAPVQRVPAITPELYRSPQWEQPATREHSPEFVEMVLRAYTAPDAYTTPEPAQSTFKDYG